MLVNHYLVLFIFILTYVFISVQRIPWVRLDRPSGVTIGSALLLIIGVIDLEQAFSYIDPDVLLFLLGMMVMIAYLEFSGFFETIAIWMIRHAHSTKKLLFLTILSSALLSAFFVNDTVCLLITPVILRATRLVKISPLPYLLGVATSANIGSALTITGNPQNMYIGIHAQVSYLNFILIMLVPVVLGLIINYAVIRLVFRREINSYQFSIGTFEPVKLDRVLLSKTLGALMVTLTLFSCGYGYSRSAFIGMALIFLIGHVRPRQVLKNLNWTILLFFAGLFIVMGAFRQAGYMDYIVGLSQQYLERDGFELFSGLSLITLLLSNLVSNVPAVILMQPIIENLGNTNQLWILLAMSSTFAGNLTLLGSVANLIVVEEAQIHQVTITFWDYVKVGVPITILTVFLGTLWLSLEWSFLLARVT
ncbi:anion transporter [bacterium]|nr:anion transporter [bacterium]